MIEMMDKDLRQAFDKAAKAMIHLGRRDDVARRYLSLGRRERVLLGAVRSAHAESKRGNPLSEIGFSPPLSFAYATSPLFVRGERLAMDGIPVALELDGRGRHRGTPVQQALNALSEHLGSPATIDDLVGWYRSYMAATPSQLSGHPLRRFARVPQLLTVVRSEQERLRLQMIEVSGGNLRFHCVCRADDLMAAAVTDECSAVPVGYNRGNLVVGGAPVACEWGRGSGLAIIRRQDLLDLLDAEGERVRLRFGLHEWGGARYENPRRVGETDTFTYYGASE